MVNTVDPAPIQAGPLAPQEQPQMALILTPLFWDKKVKIAILTLATFAALC